MIGMIIVCLFICYVSIYLASRLFEVAYSNFFLFQWIKENRLKSQLEVFPWLGMIFLMIWLVPTEFFLKNSQDYAWENVQAKESLQGKLAEAERKILVMEDEKRFVSQPVKDVPVVKAETQEDPQEEDKGQNKVVLETEQQTEDVNGQVSSVKTEEEINKEEAENAKIQAKIDAVKSQINDLKMLAATQVQASAPPAPEETGIPYDIIGGVGVAEAAGPTN